MTLFNLFDSIQIDRVDLKAGKVIKATFFVFCPQSSFLLALSRCLSVIMEEYAWPRSKTCNFKHFSQSFRTALAKKQKVSYLGEKIFAWLI